MFYSIFIKLGKLFEATFVTIISKWDNTSPLNRLGAKVFLPIN
uniref:Uncharacterized protein n=1 Tax=Anguilla anguilla TaxID=7936 RepID=A0A0E9P6Z3_ANGAN